VRLRLSLAPGPLAAIAAIAAITGCAEPEVVRVVDGRPEAGRYISDYAYGFFVRGAYAEAQGDLENAERAYQAAAVQDPNSAEIWTRLGALRCRAAPPSAAPPPDALRDFASAEEADASFAPLHRERARCLVEHGQGPGALAALTRAVALDPSDLETFLLQALALERAGDPDAALRTLRGLTVSHPRATAPWLALRDLGKRRGDAPLVREAARRARELGATPAQAAEEPAVEAVDAALRAGDLAAARHLAKKARLGEAELAVRAAALGRAALAREQAELVLGGDPTETSARIALAAAAGLSGDEAALARALGSIPQRHTAPSPLARLLFAELLARRVGADAARAWLGPAGEPGPGVDALLAATAERVRARLSGR
jgi:tetratricopeptide (TPR) repeat protein